MYETFAARHGPALLRNHRIKPLAISKTSAEKIEHEMGPMWSGNLRGSLIQWSMMNITFESQRQRMFLEGRIIDITYTSQGYLDTAVSYCQTTDLFIFITPFIPHGIHDFLGYMTFIEAFEADTVVEDVQV